ncbi:MAG: tetratricopeptide repeat protein [Terriglobia bacterium]
MASRARRRSHLATRRQDATPAAKAGKTRQGLPAGTEKDVSRLDRARALLIVALVAGATLPYLNILFNGFVYDDDPQVVTNPYIRSFHHLKEIFTTNVWSFAGAGSVTNYYRPLMTLGYLVCYKLFGLRAYGFHLVSLLLHVLIVCLVFLLAERLTGDRVGAFVAGAFFALHPIHTEPVAWIAAVTELELTFFYLLTFGIFLASARPGGGRSVRGLAAMVFTFILALLSKEQAMTLPALATVYEHFFRRDRAETSPLQKLARYGPLWLTGMAYLFFRIHFLGALAPERKFSEVGPLPIVLSAIAFVAQYIAKLLWPIRLCAYYVFHPRESVFDLRVVAGLLVLFALAALFLVCWRRRDANVRLASFGILWFLATLAPVLNAHWVGPNAFAERYLYLPSVGVAWLVGLGASRLWSRAGSRPVQRRALALAGLVVCGLFAARIVTRDRDWNNDIEFYTRTLELSPDAHILLRNLGLAYWLQGDLDKAETVFRRAVAFSPRDPDALNNLGVLLFETGRQKEAEEQFRASVRGRPNVTAYNYLGWLSACRGNTGEATRDYRVALTLDKSDSYAHFGLGDIYLLAGRKVEALSEYEAGLMGDPQNAQAQAAVQKLRQQISGAAP